MRFRAADENGAGVTMDTGTAYGGSGEHPTPMALVAFSLAGCAGMDALSILEKMRVKISSFDVEVDVRRREEVPRIYEEIKMTFIISGDGVPEDKARKAVDLSVNKYCSVGVMLREKVSITHDVVVG
jgi:putative redox protein